MELYKVGKVVKINDKYIILENNNIGWLINVVNSNDFVLNQDNKIFIYYYENNFQKIIYGFKTLKQKKIFSDLILIPGIGPKMAMNLLIIGSDQLIQMIITENIDKLSQINNISKKTAIKIVLHLKEKYKKIEYSNDHNLDNSKDELFKISKIVSSLKILGFSQEKINFAINKINFQDSIEENINNAIRIIVNENKQ